MPSPPPDTPVSRHAPVSYFVYFRTEPALEAEVGPTLDRLVDAVAARTGVRGRLLRKRDAPNLWMEVYEAVADPESFEQALAHAAREAEVERLLLRGSTRNVERFVAP